MHNFESSVFMAAYEKGSEKWVMVHVDTAVYYMD